MLDRLLIGSSSGPKDPNFRNVTLLLHGDGSNGAQNNTFLDSSSNNFTITRNGNPTQGSFSPYGTRWSNYFDGNGDYLQTPDNAAFAFGTGDYTVEAWVFPTSIRNGENLIYVTEVTQGMALGYNQTQVYVGARGTAYDLLANHSLIPNQWSHIAATRQSGTVRIFVNGVLVGSGSVTRSCPQGPGTVGDYTGASAGNGVIGYMSDVRVIKGTALYTSAFTPPTAPLTAITNTSLLTCQSNRFRDASANNFAITRNGDVRVSPFSPYAPSSAYSAAANGGSACFDGSGDYLGVTPSALSTGDFTFECWIYATGTGQYQYIYDTRASTNDAAGFCVIYNHASYPNQISIYSNGFIGTPTITVSANTWTHFALVRSGGSWRTFVNGVADIASTSASRTLSNVALKIGTGQALDYFFNGYLSNYRIVTSAVYTANFTPPTSPVTVITNTSLLLNATNAAIFDSAADNNLETVGNAQISTSVKKFGTGSMAFTSTGTDALYWPTPDTMDISTGNFTLETWVYFNGFGSDKKYAIQIGSGYWQLVHDSSFGISLRVTGYAEIVGQGSNTGWSTGQWYHVALVRNGSTFTIYRNGTSIATATNTNSLGFYPNMYIGGYGSGNSINGYLDDFRITKGVARYTANFTPPAAPFPDQ